MSRGGHNKTPDHVIEQWKVLRAPPNNLTYAEIAKGAGVDARTVRTYAYDGRHIKKVRRGKYGDRLTNAEYKRAWRADPANAEAVEREREISREWKRRNRERAREYDRQRANKLRWEREGKPIPPPPKRCTCSSPLDQDGICGWCGDSIPEKASSNGKPTGKKVSGVLPDRAVRGRQVGVG